MRRLNLVEKLTAAVLAISMAACSEPTAPALSRVSAAGANLTGGSSLLECPTGTTTQATALVTPLGGVVSAGGASIDVPLGAVLVPTYITVTVPASNYMEVDISAEGLAHYTFQSPVTVSISYARCTRNDIDKSPLSVWYIDSDTHELLAPMGGVDDKVARTVTFVTGHLSGYAVAN